MPHLYPEKLLRSLESTRTESYFRGDYFNAKGDVSKNIFLMWKDLEEQHLKELRAIKCPQQTRSYLRARLMVEQRYPVTDEQAADAARTRQEVFINLAVQTLSFCRKSKFSSLKTSTLLSIILTLHVAACEQTGAPMPFHAAYTLLENLLLRHAVERPPFSIMVFTHTDVVQASNHFLTTYLRNLKLYQYVFGSCRQLQLQSSGSTALEVNSALFQALNSATASTDLEEKVEMAPVAEEEPVVEEEPVAVVEEVVAEPTPAPKSLEDVLKTSEERELFEKALGKELAKIQDVMAQKMQEQQEAFAKRLQQLEAESTASRPSSKKGRK